MSVLTGRRGKPAGPVISAIVTALLLIGVACALPAFASADSARRAADALGPCPPTSTATADPSDTAPSDGPTATDSPSATDSPTDPGTPSGPPTDPTCAPTTAPTSTAATTTAPPTTAAPSTTAAPTTAGATAAPTTPPATIPPPPVNPPNPPGGTFVYTDTPPGDTNQKEPHGTITRAQIITRAEKWLAEKVPYSQTSWYTDADGTYRQDCSGYVSMAWDLDQNIDFWTGNLNTVSHTIDPSQLLPGDTLMSVEHTIIFAGWADPEHDTFDFFEEAHPGTEARFVVDAPLAAYTTEGFNAFRYDGVVGPAAGLPADPGSGLSFSALSAGSSEIVPVGVSTDEPAPAPWQQTVPNQQALQGLLASATATKSATRLQPQLAALAMDPAGPAPLPVLLGASALSLAFVILIFVRNPRVRVHRRRH